MLNRKVDSDKEDSSPKEDQENHIVDDFTEGMKALDDLDRSE